MESFWSPHGLTRSERPHPRQVRFEAHRVRDLLEAFGLTGWLDALVDRYDAHWGAKRLTFEAFHDVVDLFPYVMEAQSFFATTPTAGKWPTIARWLTRFPATVVAKRYALLLDRYETFTSGRAILATPHPGAQQGLPLVMCFPWGGVRGGLVAHNGTPLTDAAFSCTLPRHNGPVRVHVEAYAAWLRAVVETGWTPTSLLHRPESLESFDPPTWCPPHLSTGILRACEGNTRDAWLLSWLAWATGPMKGPSDLHFRAFVGGRSHVAATYGEMSKLIGLSVQQVRDAVASLCTRGFVSRPAAKPPGSGQRNYLFVEREKVKRAMSGG